MQQEEQFQHLFDSYLNIEKDAARQHDTANYTLERMLPLARLAGNPQCRLKIIHVAGTKGKGTTCGYLDALLRAAGRTTGFFSSPHIRTIRERFQINGAPLPFSVLFPAAKEFLALIRKADLHPSVFEIFTVLSLKLFADAHVDYAILETGIGGRLDATNFIPLPALTIITSISYDHTKLLGDTIEQIAAEKAGILKEGAPLILAEQPFTAAKEAILTLARKKKIAVIQQFVREDITAQYLPPATPNFLKENFTTAYAACECLNELPNQDCFILPEFRARFQILRREPMVLLDGAHNGDSMEKLVQALTTIYPHTKWTVILGCVKGKDVPRIVQALTKLPEATFILTNPRSAKGSALPQLLEECGKASLPIRDVIPEFTNLEQFPAGENLLFTGSFYTTAIGDDFFAEDKN